MSVLSTCLEAFLAGKKIVFFGAGQYTLSLMPLIYDKISYFVDNSPTRQGTLFWGLNVYSPEKLNEEDIDETVIIINTEFYNEIAKQCFDLGYRNIYSNMYKNANEIIPTDHLAKENFLKNRYDFLIKKYGHDIFDEISNLFADQKSRSIFSNLIKTYDQGNFDFSDLYCEGMYFNDLLEYDECEIFVDCGAFDGKNVVDFIIQVGGKYKKIYAFEPDIINYSLCQRNLTDIDNLILLNKGLSDSEEEIWFDNRGSQSSKIIYEPKEENLVKIQTIKLDSLINEPISFVKMDIEGAEYSALQGAVKIIKKYKPKLAISVYHNDDDLIRIPLLLHRLVPEYKFYLRHHSSMYVDTVLYAINKEDQKRYV